MEHRRPIAPLLACALLAAPYAGCVGQDQWVGPTADAAACTCTGSWCTDAGTGCGGTCTGACPPGYTCTAGEAGAHGCACDPKTCNGCCSAEGLCVASASMSDTQCGSDGKRKPAGMCEDCKAVEKDNPCREYTCGASKTCEARFVDDRGCASGTGKCLSGACCTGCIYTDTTTTTKTCVKPTDKTNNATTTYCGTAGQACQQCTAADCYQATCDSYKCNAKGRSKGDWAPCTGGTCFNNSCQALAWRKVGIGGANSSTIALKGVWAKMATDVYAVGAEGASGAIWHWGGASSAAKNSLLPTPVTKSLNTVAGSATGAGIWVAGDDGYAAYSADGTKWTRLANSSSKSLSDSLYVGGSTYAVGESPLSGRLGLYVMDTLSVSFPALGLPSGVAQQPLVSIWGTTTTTDRIVAAVSQDYLFKRTHYSTTDPWHLGSSEKNTWYSKAPSALTQIWGIDATALIVVGDKERILDYDATNRTFRKLELDPDISTWKPTFSLQLNTMWAGSRSHVLLAGEKGLLVHCDLSKTPAVCHQQTLPPEVKNSPDLNDIWGTGTSDVFVVGDNGTFLRFGAK